jgi:Phage phiEco32-like COOH.NH2 ligase-type 2
MAQKTVKVRSWCGVNENGDSTMTAKLTLGSDPEFFLQDKTGVFRSAIPIVKGTKEKKLNLGNGHWAFYDNVLAECNVKPGASEDEVYVNFGDCFRRLAKAVQPYILVPQASARFDASECTHPDAKVFGCEPEYCAYDLCQVQAPSCEDTFRSGGGHIHLGASDESYPLLAKIKEEDDRTDRDWGRVWVVRMLDLFVGIPSLFLDHDVTSAARRKLYGHAGTHRPKEEYGVEYRAVSNFWMRTPRILSLVYKLCMFTVKFVEEHGYERMWKDIDSCFGYNVADLRKAINESDKDLASSLLNGVVKEYLPANLMREIFKFAEPQNTNFYREWRIA